MTIPSLVFGFLVASLYGTLFHLLRGGSLVRLFFYLVLSWVGFTIGHLIGGWLGWILFPIGPLDFGTATIGSALLLIFGHWLSLVEIRRPDDKDDAV